VAVIVEDEPPETDGLRESPPAGYLLAAEGWRTAIVTRAALEADPSGWARRLTIMAAELGGILHPCERGTLTS
jgi:hypothetical protein